MLVRLHCFLCLFLAGCASIPDTYAPPISREPLTTPPRSPIGHFVEMSDPGADAYIVRDVAPRAESGVWRWTKQRPQFRFVLERTAGQRFVMDFAVPQASFARRGPVTVSIFVNGNLLDRVRFERGGERHFDKPVPHEWLRTHLPNLVTAEIDKMWVSPSDGNQLGFIITRAGFVE